MIKHTNPELLLKKRKKKVSVWIMGTISTMLILASILFFFLDGPQYVVGVFKNFP